MIDIGNVGEHEKEVEVAKQCTWDRFFKMVLMLGRMKMRLRFQRNVHGISFLWTVLMLDENEVEVSNKCTWNKF